MKKIYILLGVAFVLYIFLNSRLLFISPPVWPDEAEYSDAALNIVNNGRLFSSIFGDIGHFPKGMFWYPPLFFYYLAFLFKIFGFSIYTLRYASYIAGGIFLVLFYLFSKKFFKAPSVFLVFPLFFFSI